MKSQEYSTSPQKVDGTCRRKSQANFLFWAPLASPPLITLGAGTAILLKLQRTDGIEVGFLPTRILSLRFLI